MTIYLAGALIQPQRIRPLGQPYLYYTKLNAYAAAGLLNDRDVVRWKLSVNRAAAAAPQ